VTQLAAPDQQHEERFADLHPPLDGTSALVEAGRCLYCYDAPCTAACPTHIDVPRFIKKIFSGNLRGSAFTILDANVLGLSCSRVCPVDVLCEGACVLHRYNQKPIEIGRLQRFALDRFYEKPDPQWSVIRAPARTDKVACVGGGPASLACAAELRRHGFPVVVFDNRPLPGGLNTYGVAQYKLRPADSLREVELVRSLGVEFRQADVGTEVSLEQIEAEFPLIFLGMGLGAMHRLGIPGEQLHGVIDALSFIERYKTSAGYQPGDRVVVIGGGNTAIDAANAARRLGASEVHVYYRRSERQMPAFKAEFERSKREGVRFHWLRQPVEILGAEGRAESVKFVETCLGAADAAGRHSVQPVEDSFYYEPCDLVIPAIGQSRLTKLLETARAIAVEGGMVTVDRPTGRTSNPRYYAGGDCVNGGREVVDAVADGKRAALAMAERLEEKRSA
jgi:glutamate synthase (NADPH/NADH) small chain